MELAFDRTLVSLGISMSKIRNDKLASCFSQIEG